MLRITTAVKVASAKLSDAPLTPIATVAAGSFSIHVDILCTCYHIGNTPRNEKPCESFPGRSSGILRQSMPISVNIRYRFHVVYIRKVMTHTSYDDGDL